MRRALIFTLTLFTVCGLLFGEPIGRLEYVDGAVTLVRADRLVHHTAPAFGEPVHNGDIVETGPTGTAEVSFAGAGGITVRVGANTVYAVSLPGGSGDSPGGIEVFAGKVRVTVEAAGGRRRFEVRTPTVTMGVRGTQFDVMTAADGAVLLGVRSGLVDATSTTSEVNAGSGEVVEVLPSGAMGTVRVPIEQMDEYFDIWFDLRNEAFAANPGVILDSYARRLPQAKRRFFSDAERLGAHRGELEETIAAEASARETAKVRARVAPAAVAARGSLTAFERDFSVVLDLLRALPPAAAEAFPPALAEFISSVNRERVETWGRIAETRYILSLYDRLQLSVPGTGR